MRQNYVRKFTVYLENLDESALKEKKTVSVEKPDLSTLKTSQKIYVCELMIDGALALSQSLPLVSSKERTIFILP